MSRNFELLQRIEQERQAEERTLNVHPEAKPGIATAGNIATRLETPPNGHANIDAITELEQPVRDQIVKLVQHLFLLPNGCKKVIFSSVERGAGCSWVTAKSAATLAGHVSGSVCLVDANLRYPSLHEALGGNNEVGLADAILESGPLTRFVQQVSSPNLWLLPSGPTRNGKTVFPPDTLRQRIQQLSSEFDYLIIDAAPLSLYSEAIAMASSTDGIVLVLKANSSRRETAQKALQDAKNANVRLLGAILNQRTFPIPEAIYKRI